MDGTLIERIGDEIREISNVLSAMREDEKLHRDIYNAATACVDTLTNNGKILLIGNGGSAADAQHIAAEFVNYFKIHRPGLAAIALTTDTSILTAVGNDSHFEEIFSRQVQALGQKGDTLIAYSTSGNSKNVIKALETAQTIGIKTIGMTGSEPSKMDTICDQILRTPSDKTPHIQEGHLVMGHILSGIVETLVFESGGK
jgi:D-sedoheptulose 7-phosphate isomerase